MGGGGRGAFWVCMVAPKSNRSGATTNKCTLFAMESGNLQRTAGPSWRLRWHNVFAQRRNHFFWLASRDGPTRLEPCKLSGGHARGVKWVHAVSQGRRSCSGSDCHPRAPFMPLAPNRGHGCSVRAAVGSAIPRPPFAR